MWKEKEDCKWKELADQINIEALDPEVSVYDAEQSVLTSFVKRTFAEDKAMGKIITEDYAEGLFDEPLGFRDLPWQSRGDLNIFDPHVETFSFRQEYGDIYFGGGDIYAV